MSKNKHSEDYFINQHGKAKIADLEKRLALAEAKVDALTSIDKKIHVIKRQENTFLFGICGDTHYGSLYHDAENMHAYVDWAYSLGVRHLLIAGDILDGHKIYKGQDQELRDIGFDRQMKRLEAEFPTRDGLKVSFITGNHDASFKKEAGINVGHEIAQAMKWDFIGEDQGEVHFDYPGGVFRARLLHPDGGTAYAYSYRLQKIAESMDSTTKPSLIACGHFHKSENLPSLRNINCFQTGCFQSQTPFMARKASAAHVGGWIVEVTASNFDESYTVYSNKYISFH